MEFGLKREEEKQLFVPDKLITRELVIYFRVVLTPRFWPFFVTVYRRVFSKARLVINVRAICYPNNRPFFLLVYEGSFLKGVSAIAKINRCVVRNQAYRRDGFSIRERHNERKNVSYGNGDILPEQSHLNVHFKSCDGTYEQAFSRMVDDGTISLRGLKADAKAFDELVFDVNSAYFENHGGYDYAKQFFAEAYRLAIQEAGGEEYILSAVLHADERNKALSEQFGRDVFHYHLHVTYVPVVDKEIYFRKNNKNPELAGKLKEVIKQVSHSKKWPRFRDEKGHWVNSYSLLQDRFFEHMRAAGFTDFERGERGSTAEHLTVLEYKTQQESERAAALAVVADQKQEAVSVLDKKVEKQQERLSGLQEKITVTKQAAYTLSEIEGMAKRSMFGGKMELSPSDWETVSGLAKEGIVARAEAKDLKRQLAEAKKEIRSLKDAFNRLYEETRIFREAIKAAPKRVMDFLQRIIDRSREQREAAREAKRQRGNHQIDIDTSR